MRAKERALELARLGTMSDREVADRLAIECLSVSVDQVFRWRREAGIPAFRKERQRITPNELTRIRKVYAETRSFKACAREVHKCPRDIAFILRRAGDVPNRVEVRDE